MSRPWLEDLSEEWVAQDAQDAQNAQTSPPTVANNATKAHTPLSVPSKLQSRLPRMRTTSGSFSEIQVRHIATDLRPPKRSALIERSLSDNNLPPPASPDASHIQSSRAHSQSFSVASLDSMVYDGTVAQKPVAKSSSADKSASDHPEWRRRLLQGEIGYGDQKDLFSPMGLENIFQKPNSNASQDKKQARRGDMFKKLSAMPSSPPAWSVEEEQSVQDDSVVETTRPAHQTASEPHAQTQPEQSEGQSSMIKENEVSYLALPAEQGGARSASGQIEFENENFSPVYLTHNLRVSAPPKAIPNFRGSELANRLRHLGTPPEQEQSSVLDEQSANQSLSLVDSSLARLQDDSLPEDLPAGTPDMADVGRFVDMKRGGYSRDGSFRRRGLSPSPERGPPQSSLRNEAIVSEDEEPPPKPKFEPDETESVSPRTPLHKGQSSNLSPDRAKSSGSPLKLFDAHDTFTSARLQRRLSQLEQKPDLPTPTVAQTSQPEINKSSHRTRLSSVQEVSIQKRTDRILQETRREEAEKSRRTSAFGEGDLNKYEFSGDFSVADGSESEDNVAPDESPSMNVAPPGSHAPLKFSYDASPISRDSSKARRQVSSRAASHYRAASRSFPPIPRIVCQPTSSCDPDETEGPSEYAEGKRGPTSPFKNPKPKRRRTLQGGEEARVDLSMLLVQEPQPIAHSSIAHSNTEARHDPPKNLARPDILARRHILRPRNPTPSQRRLDELHADIVEATEAFIHSSPKMNTIREHIEVDEEDTEIDEARAAIVANEVAAFSMKRQQVRSQTRKRSVTTQDFLDEAVKIMDYIRAKGRPTSGLGSLEESESETPMPEDKVEYPSSSFTFDRPPSREGRSSAWKEPNKHELAPEMMVHLRKYQEKESDDIMGSSFRSLHASRLRGASAAREDNTTIAQENGIRIIDNPDRNNGDHATYADHMLHARTSGSSLGQTIATNASRRSDILATLAPEAVAHLIPQEVAGMSFDAAKNMWTRQKSPSREHRIPEEHSRASESEEDPFGNIPDLSIDETAERLINSQSPTRPQATAETFLEDTEEAPFVPEEKPRPVTREGHGTMATDSSSVPSKASNFGWSFPKTETRATSYSDQEQRNAGTQKLQHVRTTQTIPESDEGDIEHEIQYFEGREVGSARNERFRDFTISIAKPEDLTRSQHQQYTARNMWKHGNGVKTLPRTGNVRDSVFEEDADLSILPELPSKNYRMQVSMSVSAPIAGKADMLLPSSPTKADMTFMLSDLPEFTLNQVDECEVPNRIVIKKNGHKFSKELEDRYALGTADLVKALQDVEPNEPYWEDLREVNLSDKGLDNLHRLDEFCYRLEELHIADNNINQVKGIPYTMRRLWAQNNCLTGLTSWAELSNLQHLDISGNDIDSLDGLSELVHLRTLKVDDNKIQSLEGISFLDGLMELSAARNQIEVVDFAKANLKSVTDLDLRGNRLVEVRNLHRLPQLRHLDLDDNLIEEFPIFDETSDQCKELLSVRACGNGMTTLDVTGYFPRLESLHADRNSLSSVVGLEHLTNLRTFSIREQRVEVDGETCISNFVRNSDIRNLHVSLNATRSFELSQHLLNLQRLEMASMGLKELPDEFGQLAPNLRSVNLNFNSLQDLRPLLNIKRLNELSLVGNKLSRLRTNAMVLGKLTTLTKLDWRDNPLTLRFYAPASEKRVMTLRKKPLAEQDTDQFLLPPGDLEEDQQYLSRLDYETRIRRRVTEMMLANFCKNLRDLDGLPFDQARILVKDDIWERLLYLGVIQRKQNDNSDDSAQ